MTKKFESNTEAQASFALKLLRIQHNNSDNNSSMIFSPVSIATAMAMIYLGAQGNTAKQIRDALAEGLPESQIQTYFTTFLKRVKEEYALKVLDASEKKYYGDYDNPYSSHPIVETFNRAYINEKLIVKDDFLEKINEFLSGGIEKVNFAEAASLAEKVNSFVAQITRNNINDIVTENDFDAKTSQIFLINVIYFKGRWDTEFLPSNTKEADFFSSPEKTKKVQMMKREAENHRYSENNDFQFLTLPYRHCDLSMRIILPKKKFGLDDLISSLTHEKLMKHLIEKKYVDVKVKIPKFNIKTKFNAKDALTKLGIKDLFNKFDSNLEGITDMKPTWLDSVKHCAFISIDEEGTEAGATTAADLRGCGLWCPPRPPKPIKFTADHPFIYLITDEQNNIYFCGAVTGAEFEDAPIKLFKNPVTEFAKKIFEKKH